MSTIGSIGQTSAQKLQEILLSRLSGSGQTSRVSAASTESLSASSGDQAATNPGGVAAFQKQISDAVSTALSNLDSSSSAKEIMKAIQEAIERTLRANGIDPSERPEPPGSAAMGQGGVQGPPPGPPPSGGRGDGMSGPPPTDATGSGGQTGGLRDLIDQLLEENGFDPDKIRNELQQSTGNTSQGVAASSATAAALLQQMLEGGIDSQA